MLVKPAWICNIIVYKSKNYFVRDSGNASFPQSKKWVSKILIWSIFNNSLKNRFLACLYNGHEKKKWYEFYTWPQEHKEEPMMFFRNISLFSKQLCRNLVCMVLVLRFPTEKFVGGLGMFWKLFKEVVSLASICNKFH